MLRDLLLAAGLLGGRLSVCAAPLLVMALASSAFGWAIDCRVEQTSENFLGVRYKAKLVHNELSSTGWTILFGTSGLSYDNEYRGHFIDLMVKGSWSQQYSDGLCAAGFPSTVSIDDFGFEIGISDYEDSPGNLAGNDIGMSTRDASYFPRRFSNIDTSDVEAADKILADYQISAGESLEGKDIEVILERGEQVSVGTGVDLYRDPDQSCTANAQDDIPYFQWTVTFRVPALGIEKKVDLYINADEGRVLRGTELLNFLWENYGLPDLDDDQFKVVYYQPEVKGLDGV